MTIFDKAGRTPHSPERWASVGIILGALFLGTVVFWRAERHPRTDDAEVFANLIGIAPQVEGPIVELKVHDPGLVPTMKPRVGAPSFRTPHCMCELRSRPIAARRGAIQACKRKKKAYL